MNHIYHQKTSATSPNLTHFHMDLSHSDYTMRKACQECHVRKVRCIMTDDGVCHACKKNRRSMCVQMPSDKMGRPRKPKDRPPRGPNIDTKTIRTEMNSAVPVSSETPSLMSDASFPPQPHSAVLMELDYMAVGDLGMTTTNGSSSPSLSSLIMQGLLASTPGTESFFVPSPEMAMQHGFPYEEGSRYETSSSMLSTSHGDTGIHGIGIGGNLDSSEAAMSDYLGYNPTPTTLSSTERLGPSPRVKSNMQDMLSINTRHSFSSVGSLISSDYRRLFDCHLELHRHRDRLAEGRIDLMLIEDGRKYHTVMETLDTTCQIISRLSLRMQTTEPSWADFQQLSSADNSVFLVAITTVLTALDIYNHLLGYSSSTRQKGCRGAREPTTGIATEENVRAWLQSEQLVQFRSSLAERAGESKDIYFCKMTEVIKLDFYLLQFKTFVDAFSRCELASWLSAQEISTKLQDVHSYIRAIVYTIHSLVWK